MKFQPVKCKDLRSSHKQGMQHMEESIKAVQGNTGAHQKTTLEAKTTVVASRKLLQTPEHRCRRDVQEVPKHEYSDRRTVPNR